MFTTKKQKTIVCLLTGRDNEGNFTLSVQRPTIEELENELRERKGSK